MMNFWFNTSFLHASWLPLMDSVAMRATLLLLLAGGLVGLMRRQPLMRHRIGALTFGGLLLLPLLSVMASPWHITMPTQHALGSLVSLPSAPSTSNVLAPLEASSSAPSSPSAMGATPGSSAPTPPVNGKPRVLQLVGVIWLWGVVVMVMRAAGAFSAVRHLQTTGSHPLTSGSLAQECAQLAHELGLKRPVVLRLAESGAASLPMTWGWRKPTVLLPEDAPDWSGGQLRSVLLHELSHIRRGDWATQCLATLACALYWFHPLVWLSAARLKADAERAADEQVVDSGVKASDYCAHLLIMSRAATHNAFAPQARYGVPMARGASIEGRLRALLEMPRPRRGLARVPALLLIGSFVLAFLTLGTLRFTVKADEPTPQQQREAAQFAAIDRELRATADGKKPSAIKADIDTYIAKLPGSGTVSLVAVADALPLLSWHTPLGFPSNEQFVLNRGQDIPFATAQEIPRHRTNVFVAEVRGLPREAQCLGLGVVPQGGEREIRRWSWTGPVDYDHALPADKKLVDALGLGPLRAFALALPEEQTQVTLTMDVTLRSWHTLVESKAEIPLSQTVNGYQVDLAKGSQSNGNETAKFTDEGDPKGVGQDGHVVKRRATMHLSTNGDAHLIDDPTGSTTVSISHTIFNQDVQVVAVDTEGREYEPTFSSSVEQNGRVELVTNFKGLPLHNVSAFRVQVQPVFTVIFPNVPLTRLVPQQ